ncbi:MAG: hypothetical protein JO092_11145 [Candidatus Eremiobacteraeota bacterium]|nr:hypothetical protein [Candidatus Eremiobacteraeota bacterium]
MRWIAVILTCALAVSLPQPAKSFQITVRQKSMPPDAMLVATIVAPNRYRQTVSGLSSQNDDTIIIGILT